MLPIANNDDQELFFFFALHTYKQEFLSGENINVFSKC